MMPRSRLVAGLNLPVTLLDEDFTPDAPVALGLLPIMDVSTFVALAEVVPTGSIEQAWRVGSFDPDELLDWIAGRESEVASAPRVLARLRSLVAFPTAVGMVALDHAVVAGDFDDPLRLTEVLTIDTNRHRRVLGILGVAELTFTEFARRQAPRALADEGLDLDTRRQVIRTLAHRVHDLQADVEARAALSPLPLVECLDGEFRDADEVVLASPDNATVVGGTIALARPADGDISFELFWSWLGIHQRPTVGQLEARIDDLTGETPDPDRIRGVEAVARHLKERVDEPPFRAFVQELRDREWLPVRGEDQWSTPQDVYSVFNDYLFESTGRFLAFGRETQTELSNTVFRELGLVSEPTTDLVVGHVLNWSAEDRPVNAQVWDYLARHAQDPSLTRLRRTRCIWTGTTYRRPNEVFWADHPFGAHRAKLPIQNLVFRPFFDAVGVPDEPTARDARAVLAEIAAAVGADPLGDEDARVVRGTWELLAGLEGEDVEIARLRDEPSAVDRQLHLVEPARLYFEDRPRLSLLFDDDIRRRIIDFDPAIAPALRTAGARDLSVALQIAKLEPGDPRDDPKIDALVEDRAHAITRVTATVGADLAAEDVTALVWQRVDQLRVRYELPDEPGRAATGEEVPEALFIEEEAPAGTRRVIYVAAGEIPFRAMARELAVGLVGPRSVPVLAAALHTVLSATSAADAEAALDDLGLARLGDGDDLGLATMDVAKDLGIDDGTPGTGEAPTSEESSKDPPDATTEKPAGTDTGEVGGTQASNRGRDRDRQGSAAGSSHSRGVLRSHLPRPNDDGDREVDEEAAEHRGAVDRAGVDHVLAYERSHGRQPREMDHGHVGFDAESYDGDGRLVRVIEVKSMSGSWLDPTPALSGPQHDEAFKRGPEYWLYVVERALEASAEVHTIRDPIRRATDFGFDPGWIEVADLDASEDDPPRDP